MKKERLKILQKVSIGELTPEQADEQLLAVSIFEGDALPEGLTWCEIQEELLQRFRSFISLGKMFGEYFEDDPNPAKKDWMDDLEEQLYWLGKQ